MFTGREYMNSPELNDEVEVGEAVEDAVVALPGIGVGAEAGQVATTVDLGFERPAPKPPPRLPPTRNPMRAADRPKTRGVKPNGMFLRFG